MKTRITQGADGYPITEIEGEQCTPVSVAQEYLKVQAALNPEPDNKKKKKEE